VLLDASGWLNLAAHATKGGLAHAMLLATATVEALRAPVDPTDAFARAFLTRSSPAAAFDYVWAVRLPGGGQAGASWPRGRGELDRVCRDQALWRCGHGTVARKGHYSSRHSIALTAGPMIERYAADLKPWGSS
jgi:hypothetical protein